MSKNYNFVWIDDTPNRAEAFIGALDGSLRSTHVSTNLAVVPVNENFVEELNDLTEAWMKNPPDLILLDHNFSKVHKRLFGIHGSALAHLLRIQLPNTPIVCVSGQNLNSDDFNAEDISEYTFLFDVNQISEEKPLETLLAIASDFNLLCFPEKEPVRHRLIETLKAPESDSAALINVLPEEFEGTFVHSTSPHRLARWILNVLMERPGFLYDSLESATLLGLTEAAFFGKVKEHFESARYRGPFWTEARPLWWASALTDALYTALPSESLLPPHDAGRRFDGLGEEDFSVCWVTGTHTPAPDVVAFTDATATERRAVQHNFVTPLSEESGSVLGFPAKLRIRNERRGS